MGRNNRFDAWISIVLVGKERRWAVEDFGKENVLKC